MNIGGKCPDKNNYSRYFVSIYENRKMKPVEILIKRDGGEEG
jgi:hypothetical protein